MKTRRPPPKQSFALGGHSQTPSLGTRVKNLDPAMQAVGFTPPGSTHCFVGAVNCGSVDVMATVCAHEVGHALGLSKIRQDPDPTRGAGPTNHDAKAQPRRYGGLTLMFPGYIGDQRWLRHEHWEDASKYVKKNNLSLP